MDFKFVKENFPHLEVKINDENSLCIINNNGDDIFIYYEPAANEYTFCFSYQHIHCDKEELIEHIEGFTNARVCAIEFFQGERRCFGGNIDTALINNLTYTKLRQHYLFGNHSFKIRCWNPDYNFDGKVVRKGLKREILLEKTKNPLT